LEANIQGQALAQRDLMEEKTISIEKEEILNLDKA
jgi:hypothetical protein